MSEPLTRQRQIAVRAVLRAKSDRDVAARLGRSVSSVIGVRLRLRLPPVPNPVTDKP